MSHFRVWIETTKKGTFLVRHEDALGNRKTDYCVEPAQETVVDKKRLVGKTLAKHLRDKVKKQFFQEQLGGIDPSLLIEPLMEEYLEWQRNSNFAPLTTIHCRTSLVPFMQETGMGALSDVTRERLEKWKGDMVRRGMANETIRGRLANVRTFLNWLVENGKMNVSPFGKKLMPMKIDPPLRFFTAAEFKALDETLEKVDPLTRLAANLAHSAGLRKIEMVGDGLEVTYGIERSRICYEDISWLGNGQAELLVRKEVAKGRKRPRTLPLDQGLIDLLGSKKAGPVIPYTRFQLDHYFQTAREKSGINPKLTLHGLRHTFAKNYLQHGQGNLASLQKLMGHSTLASTMIYAQFEKSYLQDGINRAYEQRKQAEALVNRMRVA